jgi:surface carbohydrate biosynthesis protein
MGGLGSRRIEVPPRRWMLLPIGFALKAREFDGNAMLAFAAAERGWGVLLGHKSIRYRTDLPRGMHIEKNIAPGTSPKMANTLAVGRKLSACCEEGLVYSDAEEYGRRKIERDAYDLLERFFCWGENHAHDMVDTLRCNGEKIVVTGNPRFDLHRPDLRAFFANRVERIKRKYGPYILITTKFSQHNGYVSKDAALEKMRMLGKVQNDAQEEEVRGQMEFHRAGFLGFMEAIDAISRHYPDHTIVVRPHPSECHEPWKAKAATLKNVKVLCEGNVAEWILGSELLIHNNCTTGVEAYLLGKSAISYRPFCDSRFDLFLPNALSAEALALDELLELVKQAINGNRPSSARDDAEKAALARRYIANVEGRHGYERMVDALDAIDLPEEPLVVRTGPLTRMRGALRRGVKRAKRTLDGRESVALRRRHALRAADLKEAELVDILETARMVTGRFADVRIDELEKDLLCIY